jgi:hypothetical protein
MGGSSHGDLLARDGTWGGCVWDVLRAELEVRGHVVHTPDLPCDDVSAGVEEYSAAIPAANVVVGYSLGGLTIPFVEADTHVFLAALVAGTGGTEVFVPGFGTARVRDELGRSYYPDPADAARELQIPPEHAHLAVKLRRQAPYDAPPAPVDRPAYVVCTRTPQSVPTGSATSPVSSSAWSSTPGHSPMLERSGELAALLDSLA